MESLPGGPRRREWTQIGGNSKKLEGAHISLGGNSVGEGQGETNCVLWEGYILEDLTEFRSLIIQTISPTEVGTCVVWPQNASLCFNVASCLVSGTSDTTQWAPSKIAPSVECDGSLAVSVVITIVSACLQSGTSTTI